MEIRLEEAKNRDDYPIFFSKSFLKTESSEFGWIVGYIEEKSFVILPYYIYSKAFFRLLRFTNQSYFLDNSMQELYEQQFLDMVIEKIQELKVDIIIQPTTNVVFNRVPQNSISAPFGTYRVDLNQDEERLWSNLHSKHRNVIRKAQRDGVEILENEYDIDEIYSLIKSTFQRSSMNFMTRDKLKKQIENLGVNVKVFVAKSKNGILQGCAIVPYSSYSGYYLHGGSIERPLGGAMNYLQWSVILSLKKSGVREYDFVGARIDVSRGSKLETIQRFKLRFGAELTQGYLWKYPICKWKYYLFGIIYGLLSNKKGDIIDQESLR